eukprot:8577631-Pyramimonas_sp.AAC.1
MRASKVYIPRRLQVRAIRPTPACPGSVDTGGRAVASQTLVARWCGAFGPSVSTSGQRNALA